MPRVGLVWVERPGLEGLDPAEAARRAGLELELETPPQAAVVTIPRRQADSALLNRLAGLPVQWLDLAAEVGGGDVEHRLARAAAALGRAAARALEGQPPAAPPAKPSLRVLVLGAGVAALEAVGQALALGHAVTWASPFDDPAAGGDDDDPAELAELAAGLPAELDFRPGGHLEHLDGAAGDFRAWLRGAAEPLACGAVILSPPGFYRLECEALGLDPDWVTPLAKLYPGDWQGSEDAWKQAALLVPPGAGAVEFDRAVRAAHALQQRPFVQVTLLFDQARVASEGGEVRYRAARESGVLAVRVGPGDLKVGDGGRLLAWPEPVLGEEVELAPDLLAVVESTTAPRPELFDNRLLWPAWERLVPAGAPRLEGGRTARSGLYVLGALRGTPAGAERRAQAAAAVADLHQRLTCPGESAPPPAVNHDFCASCLTCVRVCPHGVPRYQHDHIHCAPAACIGCGVCAAECPAEAIAPPGQSNREVVAGLAAGIAASGDDARVLFACAQSALPALAELSRRGHQWPAGLLVQPVPCAGRVGMQLILKALALGARGVLVAGCHDGNCRSITGNLRARLRCGEAADLLRELELPPMPVRFLHMASNQPFALARAVQELFSDQGEE